MQNRLIDSKKTFQVLVDSGWWKILSQLRTDQRMSFKELVDYALSNTYSIDSDGKPKILKR